MGDIPLTIGKTKSGNAVTVSLSKMPHMLVAGRTGSGKSVFINGVIRDLIQHPDSEVGMVLLDPKRVELARYKKLPHTIDTAYEVDHMRYLLGWTVGEMEMRFAAMESAGVRDHGEMGAPWSRIVVIIDELANLILQDKESEKPLVRLASMGRAAGVHLVVATQRPSADVVTGLIRANIPTRICMPVTTKMESRIILDESGGERLTSPGSMMARLPGYSGLLPLQGEFYSDEMLDQAVARWTT
jgi:S-DNA-T family DNA segregation ATPase FtsK/SpoIIIE